MQDLTDATAAPFAPIVDAFDVTLEADLAALAYAHHYAIEREHIDTLAECAAANLAKSRRGCDYSDLYRAGAERMIAEAQRLSVELESLAVQS